MEFRRKQFFPSMALVFAVALCGCGIGRTIQYREVQNDFNAAVQADNVQSVNPMLAGANAQILYEGVLSDLTDEKIQKLDPKLKGNAYTIRAICQWRSGKLRDGKNTAENALKANLELGPRDEIVLRMIPIVVYDQEFVSKYSLLEGAPRLKWEEEDEKKLDYEDIEEGYGYIHERLEEVSKKLESEDVPVDIIFYFHFHRWRMLNNWRHFISKVGVISKEGDRDAQKRQSEVEVHEAYVRAGNILSDKVVAYRGKLQFSIGLEVHDDLKKLFINGLEAQDDLNKLVYDESGNMLAGLKSLVEKLAAESKEKEETPLGQELTVLVGKRGGDDDMWWLYDDKNKTYSIRKRADKLEIYENTDSKKKLDKEIERSKGKVPKDHQLSILMDTLRWR